MNNDLTFLIINRNGKDIKLVISQILKYYSNSKILIIEQYDNLPFLRGQLFNIAINYIDTEYICFLDNDIYIDEYIDYKYFLKDYDLLRPLYYHNNIHILNNEIIKENNQTLSYGFGRIAFFKKDLKFNGFSNLFCGYGYEDKFMLKTLLNFNNKLLFNDELFKDTKIYHISHQSNIDYVSREINKYIYNNYDKINYLYDNSSNTRYDLIYDININNIRIITVTNIRVDENYKYKNIINKHYNILNIPLLNDDFIHFVLLNEQVENSEFYNFNIIKNLLEIKIDKTKKYLILSKQDKLNIEHLYEIQDKRKEIRLKKYKNEKHLIIKIEDLKSIKVKNNKIIFKTNKTPKD